MTHEEIIEGNKLIAEFMGWKKLEIGHYQIPTGDKWDGYDFHAYSPETMKFHTSFDWLMSVVEKICAFDNEIGFEYKTNLLYINLLIFKTSIFCHRTTIYKRVVEFIKWYNSQK